MKNERLLSFIGGMCMILLLGLLLIPACTKAPAVPTPEQQTPAKPTVIELRYSSSQAPGTYLDKILNRFCDLINEKADGIVHATHIGNSALGGVAPSILSTIAGDIDMCEGLFDMLAPVAPQFATMGLPFLWNDAYHVSRAWQGPLGDEARGTMLEKGGRILSFWVTGPREIGSKKPIETLQDVQGLVNRVWEADVIVKGWRAIGTNPTVIAWAEIYTAMQTGTVDFFDSPPGMFEAQKFYEVAKYITKDCSWQHAINSALMSEKVFQSLPQKAQNAIQEAANQVAKECLTPGSQLALYDDIEKAFVRLQECGMTVTRIKDREKWIEKVRPLWQEVASKTNTQHWLTLIEEERAKK